MSEVVLRMNQTFVTKLDKPVIIKGNKRQGYTVARREMPDTFSGKGMFPKSIVLLDAPSEGKFIEFGNMINLALIVEENNWIESHRQNAKYTPYYFSRDYASVLRIIES